jgi:hypothetical protein
MKQHAKRLKELRRASDSTNGSTFIQTAIVRNVQIMRIYASANYDNSYIAGTRNYRFLIQQVKVFQSDLCLKFAQ